MFDRLINLPLSNSFLLFGARGTGKTSLLRTKYDAKDTLWIDLLNDDMLDKYSTQPQILKSEIDALVSAKKINCVVIDEVQKAPKLLNVVHQVIESSNRVQFALTGSSARRLKQKGVNLLAGRAWVNYLFPLTAREIESQFSLEQVLKWGTLPEVISLPADEDKAAFLRSYASTYIRTEVQQEQWVRKIEPFRKFLPIAAQMNGRPINYSNIARDAGAEVSTVQSYYEILEDTLMGFNLAGYHRSIRKQQRKAPKFYFFDTGIVRALERTLSLPLTAGRPEFGHAFEHFLICEIFRLNIYLKRDFELSYLLTKDDVEVDLIIDRPGLKPAFVEIKSTDRIDERHCRTLTKFANEGTIADFFVLSRDPLPKHIGKVHAIPWKDGLIALGL